MTDSAIIKSTIFFAASMFAVAAHAADIRPLVKAGFDLGGDTMVKVTFTNGDTADIKANEGFYLGGGAAIINDAKDLEFHVTLAYKFALISASNGDVEWTRWPFEALAFYRFPRVRVGGGLGVGLRYTHLTYDAKGAFAGAASSKANGVGVSFSMNF